MQVMQVRPLLEVLASHVHASSSPSCSASDLAPSNNVLEKAVEDGASGRPRTEFPVPAISLAQPWLLQHFGEMKDLFLSLCWLLFWKTSCLL